MQHMKGKKEEAERIMRDTFGGLRKAQEMVLNIRMENEEAPMKNEEALGSEYLDTPKSINNLALVRGILFRIEDAEAKHRLAL